MHYIPHEFILLFSFIFLDLSYFLFSRESNLRTNITIDSVGFEPFNKVGPTISLRNIFHSKESNNFK